MSMIFNVLTQCSEVNNTNYYIKNVVLFEGNSILPLPECLESSGWQFLRAEVSQESQKIGKQMKTTKN